MRYERQILVPQIGQEGQLKIKKSAVLIVGAGGLGSPAAFYLAAAGVGRLGLVDCDRVELSNLQRQILHSNSRLGMSKVDSAKHTLHELNPEVQISTYYEQLTENNVSSIVAGYDVVICAVDNFPTRYILNQACVNSRKPFIEAGIYHWEANVTTIIPGKGPCYNCIRPRNESHEQDSLNLKGVIGPVAGLAGSYQAIEALKVITGNSKNILLGKILVIDGLSNEIYSLPVNRDLNCAICGGK